MEKQTVKAVKHADIRGKEQTYVVIGDGEGKVVINVGEKTFNAVSKLTGNVKEVKEKK